MADYPPFMNAHGNVSRILTKIKEAKTPDRFTQDFLSTALGFPGGSARPFIPLAKRLGFLASDGSPTELYKRFRNPTESGTAVAEAMRRGYADLFARNEYANQLDKKKLEGLVTEATGLDAKAPTLRAIIGTFEGLKAFADFEGGAIAPGRVAARESEVNHDRSQEQTAPTAVPRFTYTIYINLPSTTDVAVFNAIFKSLRENMLL